MTPEAQQIAIAEACEWTDCRPVASRMADKPWLSGYNPAPYVPVSAYTFNGEPIVPPIACRESLPNYLNDLNAMHEAEKVLIGLVGWVHYSQALLKGNVHATAAQRSEAFLRTIGKWEDDK